VDRPEPIQRWHQLLETRDPSQLQALLADDVVFLSPVVHTPQKGRAITTAYLLAAFEVLNNAQFHYLNEWFGTHSAVLEFSTVVDGIEINGVDIIEWDAAQQINRFKVMVRPLKAIEMLHRQMAARLAERAGGQAGSA
jgi:SnoaL-like domain